MQDDVQKTEVRETTTYNDGDSTVERHTALHREHTPAVVVAQRIVWLIIGLINALIALRFILLLLGANQSAGFTEFIYWASAPFVAPFTGIFGEPTYGQSVFEISSVLAIVVYLLVGWGIARLLTVGRPRDEIA